MELQQRKALLRGLPYVANLGEAVLDSIILTSDLRSFPAGARIFTGGHDEGTTSLHIVASGVIKVYKLSSEGREQVLRLFHRGDTFADVSAFDGGPYPANADALDRSSVIRIPRRMLVRLMREHPEIAIGASRIMAARLRHMTGLVEDLSLRRVMNRVARLLLYDPDSTRLTQTQIAAMVGTAREMVNRSLHTLEDQGAIRLDAGAIHVRDRGKLAEIADGT